MELSSNFKSTSRYKRFLVVDNNIYKLFYHDKFLENHNKLQYKIITQNY